MIKNIKVIKPWIINPFVLYIVIWIFVLFLYCFSPSKYSFLPTIEFSVFIILTFLFSGYFAIRFNHLLRNRIFTIEYCKISIFECNLMLLSYFLEIIYTGNVVIVDPELRNSFGIPVFHVFVYTYTIYAVARDVYKFLIFKKKTLLIIPLIGFVYFILIFSRGAIIHVLFAVSLIYFATTRLKNKNLVVIVFCALLFSWLFGIAGNIRVGSDWNDSYLIMHLCNIDGDRYSLFAPFYWVEEYIVCSVRNLFYNLNYYSVNYNFVEMLYYLLPEFITKRIITAAQTPYLITLTTYTLYGGVYISGGYFGMMVVFLVHYYLCKIFLRFSNIENFKMLIGCSFISIIMILSIFDNMVHVTSFLLPIVFTVDCKFKRRGILSINCK